MEDRKREAALVKAAYRVAKQREGLTQEKLASELDVTQGLVTQWLTARSRIPDNTLLALSLRLGFDAVEVRPSLREKYELASRAIAHSEQVDRIAELAQDLTPDELARLEAFVDYLRFSREGKS